MRASVSARSGPGCPLGRFGRDPVGGATVVQIAARPGIDAMPAASLAMHGRLTGATDAEIIALDTAFASPQPWMHDYF